MEDIIKGFNQVFEEKINKIMNEYKKLEQVILESSDLIAKLTEENNLLRKKINELNEEKKSKSSSVLWETTQTQLGEKDKIIEQLKKDVEFYKRQSNKSTVTDKYPYNPNKLTNLTKLSDDKISNQVEETKLEVSIQTKQIEINGIKEIEQQEDNIKESSKKKDKSEKKKKKKTRVVDEDDEDIEKLERELLGLV